MDSLTELHGLIDDCCRIIEPVRERHLLAACPPCSAAGGFVSTSQGERDGLSIADAAAIIWDKPLSLEKFFIQNAKLIALPLAELKPSISVSIQTSVF